MRTLISDIYMGTLNYRVGEVFHKLYIIVWVPMKSRALQAQMLEVLFEIRKPRVGRGVQCTLRV